MTRALAGPSILRITDAFDVTLALPHAAVPLYIAADPLYIAEAI
jgi:hypothetical protein